MGLELDQHFRLENMWSTTILHRTFFLENSSSYPSSKKKNDL